MSDLDPAMGQQMHDLRNHLNSIAMQAEVVRLHLAEGKSAEADAALAEVIRICQQGGQTLAAMHDRLTAAD